LAVPAVGLNDLKERIYSEAEYGAGCGCCVFVGCIRVG
jgi:hypothetical protein